MKNPRILIVPGSDPEDTPQRRFFIKRTFVEVIERSGGTPIIVGRPRTDALDDLFSIADGLVLVGGHDIDPSFYNEENHGSRYVDHERDVFEFTLIKRAEEKRIPILGICRGMQVLNVAFGGSLYQDINQELDGSLEHDWHEVDGKTLPHDRIAHDVTLVEGTKLAQWTGATTLPVNSLHHQGVHKIGKGLVVSSRSPDGLIESFEHETLPFLVGVEWHPEELSDDASRKLFDAFIASAHTV